jgi:hypothetical protein
MPRFLPFSLLVAKNKIFTIRRLIRSILSHTELTRANYILCQHELTESKPYFTIRTASCSHWIY